MSIANVTNPVRNTNIKLRKNVLLGEATLIILADGTIFHSVEDYFIITHSDGRVEITFYDDLVDKLHCEYDDPTLNHLERFFNTNVLYYSTHNDDDEHFPLKVNLTIDYDNPALQEYT